MLSPSEIMKILNVLCIEYGFCLPETVRREICNEKDLDAFALARAVVRAEGLDPDYSKHTQVLTTRISRLLEPGP